MLLFTRNSSFFLLSLKVKSLNPYSLESYLEALRISNIIIYKMYIHVCNTIFHFPISYLKGHSAEINQMHAKVYIVIPIEKQILSALRNRFPFLDRNSQSETVEAM